MALLIYLRKDKRALIQLGKLIGAGAITLVLGLLPFLIAAPQMVLAHLDTLLTLPGWSSPYALDRRRDQARRSQGGRSV